jgi:hypothetical protein
MPAVNRYYSSVAIDTTLKFAITDPDATSFEVNSTAGFPTSYPYTLALGYDLSNEELVTIIGASDTILTVGVTVAGGPSSAGRGVDGTNNQTHAAGEAVKHVISARDMTEAQAHIAAESGAHGITGSFVGTTDTQALTNKTLTSPVINGGAALTVTSTDLNFINQLKNPSTNAQTGTTYTLVLADDNKFVEMNNSSSNTVTIPLNSSVAFPVGAQVTVITTGTGLTTVSPTSGVTLNYYSPTNNSTARIRARYSAVTLVKRATDTWIAIGNLL